MVGLKYPKTPWDAETPIPVTQAQYLGMIKDAPQSELPAGYAARLINLYAFGEWLQGRAGSGYYGASDVAYGTLYGSGWHSTAQKALWRYGSSSSSFEYASASFADQLGVALIEGTTFPSAVPNHFVEFGDHMYVFSQNSIWRIVLNDSGVYAYRINPGLPTVLITSVAETVTKVYGHKYVYAMARIRGDLRGNRRTTGNILEWESGTCDDASGQDYGLVFFDEKINPSQTAAHTIGVMTLPDDVLFATHFPLFRTLNVGNNSDPPGIDATNGEGNDSELLVWVDDVPVTKCWSLTPVYDSTSGGNYVIDATVSQGTLVDGDVGNVLKDENGVSVGTITEVASGTAFTYEVAASAYSICIGRSAQMTVEDVGANTMSWDVFCGSIAFAGSGVRCRVSSTGTLPAGLAAGTDYYIIGTGTQNGGGDPIIKLATSYANAIAGTAIDITDAGTGVHTLTTQISQAYCLGNGRVLTASQAATTITRVRGIGMDEIGASGQHRIVFWADGDWSLITCGAATGTAEALWSDTHAEQACVVMPASGNFTRYWNDTVPDVGTDYAVEGLLERAATGENTYFPDRYFDPIPSGDVGAITDGFMVSALRDGVEYWYSQYADKPRSMGYYRPGTQRGEAPAAIRMLWPTYGKVVFFMVKKTFGLQMNLTTEQGNSDYGESVLRLDPVRLIDPEVGVYHWETIRSVRGPNQLIALTDEADPRVRLFSGDRWDERNLCLAAGMPAVVDDVHWIAKQSHAIASYVPGMHGGYKLWGVDASDSAGIEYKCLRLAVEPTQGQGWAEITGDHWVVPAAYGGILVVRDANRIDRCTVRDRTDRLAWEEATWDQTTDDHPPFVDKETTEDAEIATEEWGKEICVEPTQNADMQVSCSWDYLRPQDPANRGASGYGESGLRDAQVISLEQYLDGEKVTANAIAHDNPEQGDVTFSGTDERARRMQFVRKTAASEFRRVSSRHDIWLRPKRGTVAERTMGEWAFEQTLLRNLEWHLCRHKTALYERVGKIVLDWTGVTRVTGPDGKGLSAYQFPDAAVAQEFDMDNPAVSGTFAVMLWKTSDIRIYRSGVELVLTTAYTTGVWSLCYAVGADLLASTLKVHVNAPAVSERVYSLRVLSATVADTALLADYYRDVIQHAGRKYEPRF